VRLSYVDEVQQVKETLVELAKTDPRVLETPVPFVQMIELGESQVEYVLRAYNNPVDACSGRPSLNEKIKTWLEQQKLSLPLPQVQVHGSAPLQIDAITSPPGSGQG
jgi:small conductance mechanosensitive channel